MKKIDIEAVTRRTGSRYPSPFDVPCRDRIRQPLGDAAALTQFGVNLLRLPPGSWSSQRHWHSVEDEFVWVVSGEVTLVTDAGEEILRAGDCAGFRPASPTDTTCRIARRPTPSSSRSDPAARRGRRRLPRHRSLLGTAGPAAQGRHALLKRGLVLERSRACRGSIDLTVCRSCADCCLPCRWSSH
jgi:mannose-6-phosphate isomerase-like protein (cupin superfamily)